MTVWRKAGTLYEFCRRVKFERPACPLAGIPVVDKELIDVARAEARVQHPIPWVDRLELRPFVPDAIRRGWLLQLNPLAAEREHAIRVFEHDNIRGIFGPAGPEVSDVHGALEIA